MNKGFLITAILSAVLMGSTQYGFAGEVTTWYFINKHGGEVIITFFQDTDAQEFTTKLDRLLGTKHRVASIVLDNTHGEKKLVFHPSVDSVRIMLQSAEGDEEEAVINVDMRAKSRFLFDEATGVEFAVLSTEPGEKVSGMLVFPRDFDPADVQEVHIDSNGSSLNRYHKMSGLEEPFEY